MTRTEPDIVGVQQDDQPIPTNPVGNAESGVKFSDPPLPPGRQRKSPVKVIPIGNRTVTGMASTGVRKRFSDKRYPEGRALEAAMDLIKADIGPSITGIQQLLLGTIRAKIIVIIMLSTWLDGQQTVIDSTGHVADAIQTLRQFHTALEVSLKELKVHSLKVDDIVPGIAELTRVEKACAKTS